jgi:superfamily II DNA or RNA helicase
MATARQPKTTFFVQRHLFSGLTSFAELEQKIVALPEGKTRGEAFEQFVKVFLLLEPEYASKLKNVWLYNEVPDAIVKKLKLPSTDQGIDIVAETCDGEFWAVQCKYRQLTDQSLTWREISTFTGLAFGVCRGFAFGLICSTTERITNVLKNQERIGFCALDAWQELDADFWIRLQAHFTQKPKSLLPSKPRPHQRAAIKDAHQHYITKKAKRGKLIMPCGSGKSLTAYWIAEKLDARRIVIAVPSLALIRQTLKVWLRETTANRQAVEWICVCSDESAGRVERDDVAVLRQDLGVPCLTAPDEIAAWLKRKHHGLTVVFTTYQSGEAIAKAARSARFRFDLGIMDEAHKTVGDGGKLFSHLLHDKNLPIRQRIFMTATERRYAGQSDTVLSMDDPAIYGEAFHLLSFKRAMEYDPPILCDYKIISIAVSRDEVAELIRKNVFVKPDKGRWNQEIEADMLASLVALRKAMIKYPIHHAVSFHGSIQRAELFKTHNDAFSHAFPKYGSLETFHVSGKTPTGTRARVIGEFAGTERAIITNARCLTEGVDVPGIDCVLFADPRGSAVDIVQAVGRALRSAPGKKLGYVIVPILHDADATPDDIFESESFQEILTTLRALAANDDRIIEYFRAISQGRQRNGGGSVEFEMDERLAQRIDLTQFVRDIELKCWDRLAKLSWRPFEDARVFARNIKLQTADGWREFCQGEILRLGRLPSDIPAYPNETYADKGWKSWGDWLGTGRVANQLKEYLPFREARAIIHKLKLGRLGEWFAFCKGEIPMLGLLPKNIPTNPHREYADQGWKGYGDWLGTGRVADRLKEYRSYREARAYVHRLKLKSRSEWFAFCKGELPQLGRLPADIPSNPNNTYADRGWKGMGDWLGTGIVAPNLRKYRPFREAQAFARKLKLNNRAEWRAFCKSEMPKLGKLPNDIPATPDQIYITEGWNGIGDWLGTGKVSNRFKSKQYLPFADARRFARTLKLKGSAEWFAFCKGEMPQLERLPANIPSNPNRTYAAKGWKGMGDWLGSGRTSQTR